MIIHVTKVIIRNKSPQQIFNFLLHLNTRRYIQMCPSAHKEFKLIKGNPNIIGSIYYFHEVIGNLNLHKNWIVTDAKPNDYIDQKAVWFYPVNLHITLQKVKTGTELTHDLCIGFNFFGIEKIVDWFGKTFILTDKQLDLLEQHAKEEFESLEKLA